MTTGSPGVRSKRGIALLTVANFALVLAGLAAIAAFGEERTDAAVVNVWSIWGIAHISIGQTLQVVAAMAGGARSRHRIGRVVLAITPIAAVAIVALRSNLFAGLGITWPIAAIIGVFAAGFSGVLRGELARQRKANLALAVVCAENGLRAALLALVLIVDLGDAVVPFAVVAPFALSLPLLLAQLDAAPGSASASASGASPWGRAVLTMIPSLASYALIPVLSATDRLPDAVDALAIDAALARGPVQVAVFLAPKVLEGLVDPGRRSVNLLSPALGGAVAVAAVVAQVIGSPSGLPGRLVAIVLVGSVGLSAYLALLSSVDQAGGPGLVTVAVAAAAIGFVLSVALGSPPIGLAPVAWAAVGAVLAVLAWNHRTVAALPPPGESQLR